MGGAIRALLADQHLLLQEVIKQRDCVAAHPKLSPVWVPVRIGKPAHNLRKDCGVDRDVKLVNYGDPADREGAVKRWINPEELLGAVALE